MTGVKWRRRMLETIAGRLQQHGIRDRVDLVLGEESEEGFVEALHRDREDPLEGRAAGS